MYPSSSMPWAIAALVCSLATVSFVSRVSLAQTKSPKSSNTARQSAKAAPESAPATSPAPAAPAEPPTETTAKATAQTSIEARPLEVHVRGRRPGARGINVEKVDRKMLERFGASSVSEALDRLPSTVSAFGSRGDRMLSLRGFEQRQILVTIDGAPIQVPYDGALDLGKFPLGLVDHITVIKGSGSLLFGPNGLGGAVDIATKRRGEGPDFVIASETAPFYASKLSGIATGKFGPVDVVTGIASQNFRYFPMSSKFKETYNEDGNERENSDRKSITAMGKASWDIDDNNVLIASAWNLSGQYGVPPGVFDLSRRFWRWTDWHVNSYAIAHGYRGDKMTIDETLYISMVGNTLDNYDNGSYITQELPASGTSIYDDRTIGGNVRVAYRFACRNLRCMTVRAWLGAKKDWHHGQSQKDGPWNGASTTTITGAAQIDGYLGGQLLWLAGAQVDGELPGTSTTGTKPDAAVGVGPMGAITWQPYRGKNSSVDITASAAHRTRFPTLKERFTSAFGALTPNPGLKPERSTNMSLDASIKPMRELMLDVGVFDSEVRDLVVRMPLQDATMQWQNVGKARYYGVELAVRATPLPWIDTWGGWTMMKAKRLDTTPPEDKIEYRPRHKLTLGLAVSPIAPVELTLIGRYIGAQDFYNIDFARWGELGGFYMLDTRVQWYAVEGLRVWLQANNITDTNAMGQYSFPEPGRQLWLGAAFEWPDLPTKRAGAF